MKNWKTTLFSALLAIGIAVEPLISTGHIDWKKVGVAAFVALIGYFAKDADNAEK